VILDKKPVLPKEDIVVTQEISERYHGSPKKYLYAANQISNRSPTNQSNNCMSSPSDLEWEHAWDCLTNSGFDTQKTNMLHQEFKRQLLKNRFLRQQQYCRRKKNLSESSTTSGSSLDAQPDSSRENARVQRYFRWRAHDNKNWSKKRVNYKLAKRDKTHREKHFKHSSMLFVSNVRLYYVTLCAKKSSKSK